MNKAQEIYAIVGSVQTDQVKMLHKWIDEHLLPKFINSAGREVNIMYESLPSIGLEHKDFMALLGAEGFSVEYKCKDQPCAFPYYTIRIPPQGDK